MGRGRENWLFVQSGVKIKQVLIPEFEEKLGVNTGAPQAGEMIDSPNSIEQKVNRLGWKLEAAAEIWEK